MSEEEQARRREKWVPREYREKRGVLYRYARDVAVSFLVRYYLRARMLTPLSQPANLGAYCD